MIFEPMVRSTKTVQLSCIKISTVSKWGELSLEPRHLGVPSGASKTILSLWYVPCKLCNYLATTLALSPNGLKRASTWASSPSGTIECVQNDFWDYGTSKNGLAPRLTLSQNRKKWDSTWPTSPRSSIWCIQNDLWAYGMFDANRAPILPQD